MLSLCSDSKQFGVGKVPWGKRGKICLMLSTLNYFSSNVGWTYFKKKKKLLYRHVHAKISLCTVPKLQPHCRMVKHSHT